MTQLPNPFNDLCAVSPSAEPVAVSQPSSSLVAATAEFTMVGGPTPPDLGCMPDIPDFLRRTKS